MLSTVDSFPALANDSQVNQRWVWHERRTGVAHLGNFPHMMEWLVDRFWGLCPDDELVDPVGEFPRLMTGMHVLLYGAGFRVYAEIGD